MICGPKPRSGDIPVATGFSRWKRSPRPLSAVGTKDLSSRCDSTFLALHVHRLKPVAKWNAAAMRLKPNVLNSVTSGEDVLQELPVVEPSSQAAMSAPCGISIL